MRRSFGVFSTDQPTRDGLIIPASALATAEREHRLECLRRGASFGMPTHMQHDMHRLVGWSQTFGLYLDNQMVRTIGRIDEPETDEEKEELASKAERFWLCHHQEGVEHYKAELIARLAPVDLNQATFLRMEAAVAKRSGLAAEIYPDLFRSDAASVDKDGLADYRKILKNMEEVQPGVFHDRKRGLLLFAHRFFRRSLSHRNKLNSYFLQSFEETARENAELRVRIKLDPDLLGHPDSAKNLIELEYWHGPLYDDNIICIPNGVAEHKANDAARLYEGVDRTQVWWKAPETRRTDSGQKSEYRTFEVEELVKDPAGGLLGGDFGCRYAHAEFSADEAAITHFDGAIRAYTGMSYLERIETSIDRGGKHAAYTKLFRFDGALGIPHWKRLLSDFFRGNPLIPEYLGAPVETAENLHDESIVQKRMDTDTTSPVLAALISFDAGRVAGDIRICAEQYQQIGERIIPYVEIGTGAVANYIKSRLKLSDVMAVGITDDVLNLSRIAFGNSENIKQIFEAEVSSIANALTIDCETHIIQKASVPLCWNDNGLLATLTIAGDAIKVASVLRKLPAIVDPSKSASEWVEPLSKLLKSTDPGLALDVHWDGVQRGLLSISRSGTVHQQMLLPDALKEQLVADGVFDPEDHSE